MVLRLTRYIYLNPQPCKDCALQDYEKGPIITQSLTSVLQPNQCGSKEKKDGGSRKMDSQALA